MLPVVPRRKRDLPAAPPLSAPDLAPQRRRTQATPRCNRRCLFSVSRFLIHNKRQRRASHTACAGGQCGWDSAPGIPSIASRMRGQQGNGRAADEDSMERAPRAAPRALRLSWPCAHPCGECRGQLRGALPRHERLQYGGLRIQLQRAVSARALHIAHTAARPQTGELAQNPRGESKEAAEEKAVCMPGRGTGPAQSPASEPTASAAHLGAGSAARARGTTTLLRLSSISNDLLGPPCQTCARRSRQNTRRRSHALPRAG
eukprot:2227351-Rhodomonas_salina.2